MSTRHSVEINLTVGNSDVHIEIEGVDAYVATARVMHALAGHPYTAPQPWTGIRFGKLRDDESEVKA